MIKINSLKGINRTVFILGLVSLFTDISSEMIIPLIPLFLGVLGVEYVIIGLIEGIAESTANIVKGLSGIISDKVEKKRNLLLLGYGLSSVSKPIIAFASTWHLVLGARFGDRIGKGIRTSPRDHLLSSSVDENNQGIAFGFHRAMDTTGAVIGAFFAFSILIIFATQADVYRIAFLISFIPAFIAILIILLLKETHSSIPKKEKRKIKLRLPKEFWCFLMVVSTFGFVQVSIAFLILRAEEVFLLFDPNWWPITGSVRGATFALFGFLLFNIIYAIFATYLGSLSDKIGRIPVLVGGLVLFCFILLIFSLVSVISIPELTLIGMMGYGLYIASTEGILKAFVADMTRKELISIRGTSFGLFNLTLGLSVLFSSIIFGYFWDIFGSSTTFLIYAFLTMIPILGFLILNSRILIKDPLI